LLKQQQREKQLLEYYLSKVGQEEDKFAYHIIIDTWVSNHQKFVQLHDKQHIEAWDFHC